MGVYNEYVGKQLNPEQLDTERKKYLKLIGENRGTVVLVYASKLTSNPLPVQLPIGILYEDILPFIDMIGDIDNDRVSVLLETPGGAGEVGRQLVESLHDHFSHVEFIVPGTAKSAGTIMVLGGHEILMGPCSSLGPIDAQINQDGKVYSADAFIEGLDRIKEEVIEKDGFLNPAYIPILQRISPGEIQNALNALEFARETVTKWLKCYKFANWDIGESSGRIITPEIRESRAREISKELASQSRWKTHGHSLRIAVLRELGLKITDYSEDPELFDCIERYSSLLRLTFDTTDIFKLFETQETTFAKRFKAVIQGGQEGIQNPPPLSSDSIIINMNCPECGTKNEFQLDFKEGMPLKPGAMRYPDEGIGSCSECKFKLDLQKVRCDIERKLGKRALTPQPKEM